MVMATHGDLGFNFKISCLQIEGVMLKMEGERKLSSSICLKKFSWNLQEKIRTMTPEMWLTILTTHGTLYFCNILMKNKKGRVLKSYPRHESNPSVDFIGIENLIKELKCIGAPTFLNVDFLLSLCFSMLLKNLKPGDSSTFIGKIHFHLLKSSHLITPMNHSTAFIQEVAASVADKLKKEEVVLKRCWLACYWGLAAKYETGVFPTPKNIGENKKYVGKGYPDVPDGVGKNVGIKASEIPHSRRSLCRRVFRRRENLFSDMSTNCLHSPFCGPSAWVPNQGLLSSLVVYPTPDRISHPQRVVDYPLG
uniref:Uncharacterized protein n=1 Tax=Cucumis melo TaxID=3656 RepID=A0A9I9EHF7_CUCME